MLFSFEVRIIKLLNYKKSLNNRLRIASNRVYKDQLHEILEIFIVFVKAVAV